MKLLKRKDQADRQWLKTIMKDVFARLVRFTERQARLEDILKKAYQRHIEQTFDRIKETSWYREERKLALESIIVKRVTRESLNVWISYTRKLSAAKRMLDLKCKMGDRLRKIKALHKWRSFGLISDLN